jgi:hypothetical protein
MALQQTSWNMKVISRMKQSNEPLKPKYQLDELVRQCDLSAPPPADMAIWASAKPVGREKKLWSNSNPVNPKKRVGRPTGSGAQQPAIVRTRTSREQRACAGAVCVEATLDPTTHQALLSLMQHWNCTTKKETIERAIQAAAGTVFVKQE